MKALPASLEGMPQLWRGRQRRHAIPALSTGHPRLDACLPGGGWPVGALTELLSPGHGIGEFSLLLPALAGLTQRERWTILVDPPWVPYPPSLCGHGLSLDRLLMVRTGSARESMWACEQALREVRGGMVVAWLEKPGFTQLRRLQMAARDSRQAAFLFRPVHSSRSASPAALRLQLEAGPADTRITVLKCRGQRPNAQIRVQRTHVPGMNVFVHTGSRRRPADPGWASRAKRAAPEGSAEYITPSSAAAFRRRREQGSETP